jgi:hypothetical protein
MAHALLLHVFDLHDLTMNLSLTSAYSPLGRGYDLRSQRILAKCVTDLLSQLVLLYSVEINEYLRLVRMLVQVLQRNRVIVHGAQ